MEIVKIIHVSTNLPNKEQGLQKGPLSAKRQRKIPSSLDAYLVQPDVVVSKPITKKGEEGGIITVISSLSKEAEEAVKAAAAFAKAAREAKKVAKAAAAPAKALQKEAKKLAKLTAATAKSAHSKEIKKLAKSLSAPTKGNLSKEEEKELLPSKRQRKVPSSMDAYLVQPDVVVSKPLISKKAEEGMKASFLLVNISPTNKEAEIELLPPKKRQRKTQNSMDVSLGQSDVSFMKPTLGKATAAPTTVILSKEEEKEFLPAKRQRKIPSSMDAYLVQPDIVVSKSTTKKAE